MYICRLVVRNFRNFAHLDVAIPEGVTCVIGENNTGKTNLLHAIRLALDTNLSSQFRQLLEHDIHCGIDISTPNQILISVEFTNYQDHVNECALVGSCEVDHDLARITYRFRPRQTTREQLASGQRATGSLTLEDYHWEMTGGGDKDPAKVQWDEEIGSALRFSDLQAYQVEYLPALRDVRQNLHSAYGSPLAKLLNASNISPEEKHELVEILKDANSRISGRATFDNAGCAINEAFARTAGEAFKMGVRLGMADPSFTSIARGLTVLLSNDALKDFDPSRNGLGLNNVLFISMLIEYFERRVVSSKSAGQLLLIEEPEAHLHPQLQRVLHTVLCEKPVQCILTTHSTHISSHAPLSTYVVLTNRGAPAISCCVPAIDASLTARQIGDLERYLDATRSTLLFARKVILVEGPAELFLIPSLLKEVMNVDLDSHGVSVVPIYGRHFEAYAALFGPLGLQKKCAIIADGDLDLQELNDVEEDTAISPGNLSKLENEHVKVFKCPVTFERAITVTGTLLMLARACTETGHPRTAIKLRHYSKLLRSGKLDNDEKRTVLADCRRRVLRTAKVVGKARFAQVASKHVSLASEMPRYIKLAVEWLFA